MSISVPQTGTLTGNDKKNAITRQRFRDPYLKENAPIKIFNVGQWGMGHNDFIRVSTFDGMKLIPLRKEGEKFSEALEVTDPYIQYSSNGLGSSERETVISGMRMAQEIIGQSDGSDLSPGVNFNKSKDTDLRMWGVFIAKGAQPTEEELFEANRRYRATLEGLVAEARMLWGMNEKIGIRGHHYFAAKVLGVKEPWNSATVVEERPSTKSCPDCANQILAAARVCMHCKYRFPEEPPIALEGVTAEELEELTKPKHSGKAKQ